MIETNVQDPFSKLAADVFMASSFAGLASLLRSKSEINVRTVVSAFLNSGIIGLILFYYYCHDFNDQIEKLFALCMLAGVGGASIIDALIQFIKGQLKINISISKTKE